VTTTILTCVVVVAVFAVVLACVEFRPFRRRVKR
jgi:hypothetical protein